MSLNRLTFKIAATPGEFEQIHQLNYRTFVEEIPQHPPNHHKRLVDKFHDENCYCVCLDEDRLVGMMALRANRPFSLDGKLADLDTYLPRGAAACEFRLLALEPAYRKPGVFARLLRFAAGEAIKQGHTLAIASGTVRQARLYARMGFVPFAEPVGPATASYQPMYLSLPTARKLFARLGAPCPEQSVAFSFMPGPVEVSAAVQQAVGQPPVSHRSAPFLHMVADVKQRLLDLTGASGVELLLGSGTLGNDVVAAQLKLLSGRGLVLSNGEFGARLVDHASRMGLVFERLCYDWGEVYDLQAVACFLAENPEITWLWTVHCETSTGILNDLAELKALCRRQQVKLCLDCTSSLGTVAVDLRGVYLASSVSGKGLAAFPGVSLVFYNHLVTTDESLPRYLDLGFYRLKEGTPFTHSSNLVAALQQALVELQAEKRFSAIHRVSERLREQLSAASLDQLVSGLDSSPAVITVALPSQLSSRKLGDAMEKRGWLLSYRSGYLLERNLIQVCLMGVVADDQALEMVRTLTEVAAGFLQTAQNL